MFTELRKIGEKQGLWPIFVVDVPRLRGVLQGYGTILLLCFILFLTGAINFLGFILLLGTLLGAGWFSLYSLAPMLAENAKLQADLALVKEEKPKEEIKLPQASTQYLRLLTEVAQDITALSDSLSSITLTIDNVANGSRTQATALGQMVHTIMGAATSIAQAAEKSLAATEKVTIAVKTTDQGQAHMQSLIEMVSSIEENAGKIAAVNEMISKISGKTNMLSLNASLEAARVGAQGRGFAVVAEAVRKLAANTATQAEEIGELTKNASLGAQAGFRTAAAVGTNISNLTQEIQNVNMEIEAMANIIAKERDVMENLSSSVGDISFTSEMNAMMAEEGNASISEIATTFENIRAKLTQFKEGI